MKARVEEGRKSWPMKSGLRVTPANGWKPFRNTPTSRTGRRHLNRLIKEIVVHESIDSDKTRHISIEIHFNLKPIPEVEQVSLTCPAGAVLKNS